MTILHIIGKPRQGKGVLTSKLALDHADAGGIVDSNYHMDSPNVHWIDFYELLTFLKKPRQTPQHLLVIDELPGWCDSYVSQSKSSRFATHFLNQSQKLGYDLIFTSQRSMRADINFRELSDCRLRAEKKEGYFKYHVLDPDEINEDVETGKTLKLPFSLAQQFWNRFDTYEAVPPVGLDAVLSEMQKGDPERLRVELDRQVQILLGKWEPGSKVDRISVTSALIDAGEPIVHAALVAYRLAEQLRRNRIPQLQTETPSTETGLDQQASLWRSLTLRK